MISHQQSVVSEGCAQKQLLLSMAMKLAPSLIISGATGMINRLILISYMAMGLNINYL